MKISTFFQLKTLVLAGLLNSVCLADETTDLTDSAIFLGNILESQGESHLMDRFHIYDLVHRDGKIHIAYGNTRNTRQNDGMLTYYREDRPVDPVAFDLASEEFQATATSGTGFFARDSARIRNLFSSGNALLLSTESGAPNFGGDRGSISENDVDTDAEIWFFNNNAWEKLGRLDNPVTAFAGAEQNLWAFYELDFANVHPDLDYANDHPEYPVSSRLDLDAGQVTPHEQANPPGFDGEHLAAYGEAFLFNGHWFATSATNTLVHQTHDVSEPTGQPWMIRLAEDGNSWEPVYALGTDFHPSLVEGKLLCRVVAVEDQLLAVAGNGNSGTNLLLINGISPAQVAELAVPGHRVYDTTSAGTTAYILSFDETLSRSYISRYSKTSGLEVLGYCRIPPQLCAIEVVGGDLYFAVYGGDFYRLTKPELMTYHFWQGQIDWQSNNSDPLADPNKNTLNNMWEYHLARDPIALGNPVFSQMRIVHEEGDPYFLLEFRRRKGSDLALYISPSLGPSANWRRVTDTLFCEEQLIDPDPLNDGLAEDVRVKVFFEHAPVSAFLRFAL